VIPCRTAFFGHSGGKIVVEYGHKGTNHHVFKPLLPIASFARPHSSSHAGAAGATAETELYSCARFGTVNRRASAIVSTEPACCAVGRADVG